MASRVRSGRSLVAMTLSTALLVFGLLWLTQWLLESGSDGAGIAPVAWS
jgi:hypothetical protein